MKARTLGLLSLLPFSAGGCALWGDKDWPCERTATCPIPQDALRLDAQADIGAERGPEPRPDGDLDGESDASPDRVVDSSADAGYDDGGRVADATGEDSSGCDKSRTPAENSCTIDEQSGVFVAPAKIDSMADGTRARPYGSLSAALTRAKADGKRVYVCDDGTGYSEHVTIGQDLDGVQMFGGFECAGWSYSKTSRAKLAASTSPVMTITNLLAGIVLEDFEIIAPDATTAGASSVGVVVNQSAGVVLRRVKISAGKGKDGTNGENGGGPTSEPALAGVRGNDGDKACTANPNPGGPSTPSICGGVLVGAGAKGGDGSNPPIKNNGGDGDDGTPTYTGGKHGLGEPVSGTWSCSTGRGQDGDNGSDGLPGASGTGPGSLSVSGWKGNDGTDGSPGQPGQGGGGGGGAKAPSACTANDGGALSPSGASGGSGGAGGCGGLGGKAGRSGGSSIALVSIASGITLEACELAASDAGKGGNGGNGQPGGSGGAPGAGGTKGSTNAKDACDGGKGGGGGNGGPGGGGAGGHSLGVAFLGNAPAGLELIVVATLGTAGVGGQPGTGATGRGMDGLSARWQAFDASDAGN